MCGRYQFTMTENDDVQKIVRHIEGMYGPEAMKYGEVRPTNRAPVLMPSRSGFTPDMLTWGFQTSRSLVINARGETVAEKPLFKEGIASKRCVIPSTGFFEWNGAKRQYLFNLPGAEILYMAGIYATWSDDPCYCILTTAANESMQEIHDRMPLILTKDQIEPWLNDPAETASFLHMTPPQLEKAPMDEQLSLW